MDLARFDGKPLLRVPVSDGINKPQELSHQEPVSVAYLSRLIGVSEATVRRDLTELAQRGKLNKVHGGALPIRETFHSEEPTMEVKRQLHTPEKKRIAQYTAAHRMGAAAGSATAFSDGLATWDEVRALLNTL